MIDRSSRVTFALAALVFLVASTVYFITLTPTVPFWDAGEFIAVSYILGIPHPPGTPLYVLLGRIATLVPWASIAERVNALSAVPAALAVMFTYLTGLKLARMTLVRETRVVPDWLAHLAAVTGALMLAFSDSYWENAIEAEVYSLMSLAQILVFWLGLRWWEEHERKPTAGPLLLAVYVMWLCVGLHLGVGIMGIPLLVLAWLVDRRVFWVFLMPFLSVALVTMGLERMAGGVLLLSILVFLVWAFQKRLNGWVWSGSAGAGLLGMGVAFGDKPFTWPTAIASLAAVLGPLILNFRKVKEARILVLALALMAIGYSTHAYLPIRAQQHPAINEGNPANWDSLRDLLERKQYGQMNMFVRRAPLSVQLDKEFWRYFRRQWPLFQGSQETASAREALMERVGGAPWGSLLPLVLGVMGALWQARRSVTAFLYTGSFVGLTTAGMILFLNFSPAEVRERDYFFQSGYHAFSLWIAIGVVWAVLWIRDLVERPDKEPAAAAAAAKEASRAEAATATPARSKLPPLALATAALLATMPIWLAKTLWYTHDRRGNFVAHDYAYNMLAPLAPNSFMFTNGDNDTFPLWYMQQVENFRKDVRVVNLSLLNTDWYIRQLRDEEPKVPIQLDDAQIKILGHGAVPHDSTGQLIYTSEYMVHHILRQNRDAAGRWRKQPYFAVTVPNDMGYEKHFTLEGLVNRVNPDTVQDDVDPVAVRKALYETFKYRGLFRPEGAWDPTVYKDENAATLSRNYASAHLQLAFWYRRNGQLPKAVEEMERIARMFPDMTQVLVPLGTFYLDAGDTAKATALFARLVREFPNDPEVHYYYGVTQIYRGQVDGAVQEFERAIQLEPRYKMAYYAAFYALSESGQNERAMAYLQRLVDAMPDDAQARNMLESQRALLGGDLGSRRLLPRPPLPTIR